MYQQDERELHKKVQEIAGRYEAINKTNNMKIILDLDAIPHYAGGKGCPDEILRIELSFELLGTKVKLSAPVLIESEKAGASSAIEDLEKFCFRSLSGEQKSYIEIPMLVVGGQRSKRLGTKTKQISAKFPITQIPKRVTD